jgi:hypothetical protein
MSTRGFSKRERDHIINFILQGCSIHPYSLKDINTWLYALWSGNVYAYRSGMTEEYETLLSAIPSSQLNAVRKTATLIAGGSGRQVLTNEAISRLEQDFC